VVTADESHLCRTPRIDLVVLAFTQQDIDHELAAIKDAPEFSALHDAGPFAHISAPHHAVLRRADRLRAEVLHPLLLVLDLLMELILARDLLAAFRRNVGKCDRDLVDAL